MFYAAEKVMLLSLSGEVEIDTKHIWNMDVS